MLHQSLRTRLWLYPIAFKLILSVSTVEAYQSVFLNDLFSDINLALPPNSFNLSTAEFGHATCSFISHCTNLRVGEFFVSSRNIHLGHYAEVSLKASAREMSVGCSGRVLCNTAKGLEEFGLDVFVPRFSFRLGLRLVKEKRSVIPTGLHFDSCDIRAKLDREDFKIVSNRDGLPLRLMQVIVDELAPVFAPSMIRMLYCQVSNDIAVGISAYLASGDRILKRVMAFAEKEQGAVNIPSLERSVDQHRGNGSLLSYEDGLMGAGVSFLQGFTTEILSKRGVLKLLMDKLQLSVVELPKGVEATRSLLGAKIGVAIKEIEIQGWDGVRKVAVAQPLGKYTLEHELAIEKLQLSLSLDIMSRRLAETTWSSRLPLHLRMSLDSLHLVLQTLLALDEHALSRFTLPPGDSSSLWNIVGCDISSIRNVSIPFTQFGQGFTLYAPSIASPVIDDFPFLLETVSAFGVDLLQQIGDSFTKTSVAAAGFLLGETLQEMTKYAECTSEKQPLIDTGHVPEWIDWRRSSVASYVRQLPMTFLMKDDLNLNRLFAWALRFASRDSSRSRDKVEFNGVVLDTGKLHVDHIFPSFGSLATVRVTLKDVTVGGLQHDILEALDIMIAESPYELLHRIRLNLEGMWLNFTLAINASHMTRSERYVTNEVAVKLGLGGNSDAFLKVVTSSIVQLDPRALLNRSIKELFKGCWGSAFGQLSLQSLNADYYSRHNAHATIEVKCLQCDSQVFLQNVEKLSTAGGNAAFLAKLSEKADEILAFLNGRDQPFGGFTLNRLVASVVERAQMRCNHTLPDNAEGSQWHKPAWLRMRLFMACGAVLCSVTFVTFAFRARRRSRRERLAQDERLVPLLQEFGGEEATRVLSSDVSRYRSEFAAAKTLPDRITSQLSVPDCEYLLKLDVALFQHGALSRVHTTTVVLLIIADFLLLVWSSMFVMGEVRIVAHIFGEEMETIPMLTLSLDNCIDMMLEGQAWIFAAFIGTCSGMFPWFRAGLLLYACTTPPNVLPTTQRGRLLRYLSTLGKWQFAEMYLFVILQVSMGVVMTNPTSLTFMEPGAVIIAIECVPQLGLLVFVVASIGAAILNEIILAMHLKADIANKDLLQQEPREVLERDALRSYKVLLKDFCCLLMLILAMTVDVYAFEFMGMAGMGIQMMSEDGRKRKSQSVLSLLTGLGSSDVTHQAGPLQLPLLVSAYATFAIVAPLLARLTALAPFHNRQLRAFERILTDLAGIEVLCFTTLVVVLQLSKFFAPFTSQLTFCPGYIGEILGWGGATKEESACFGTQVELLPAFTILCMYALFTCGETVVRIWRISRY